VLKRLRRFSLFVVLGYGLHFPVQRFVELPSATAEQWRSFLAADVLQLIGVTFIGVQTLVLLARSRRVFGWTAFALALSFILVTPLFWGVDWAGRVPLWLAAYLSPAWGSQFPLFPWSAYVLVGAALGQWYLTWGTARLDWYANVALFAPGLGLVTLAVVIGALPVWLVGVGAWDAVPNQVALRMGASLILLSLIARASQQITGLPHVFGAVAQETLLIYFVHLCIVYGSIWNAGLYRFYGDALGPGATALAVLAVVLPMIALAWQWNVLKHHRPRVARVIALALGIGLAGWLI
jgi:uncharacterized membrane protein